MPSTLDSQCLLCWLATGVDSGCCSDSKKNTSDRRPSLTHESPEPLGLCWPSGLISSHPQFLITFPLHHCFHHTAILVPKACILNNRWLRKAWTRPPGEFVVIRWREKMMIMMSILGQKNSRELCRACTNRLWQVPILRECFPLLKPETNFTEWAEEGKKSWALPSRPAISWHPRGRHQEHCPSADSPAPCPAYVINSSSGLTSQAPP